LVETGMSICNPQPHYDWGAVLVSVTLRRLDLATEIYHLREPQKIPLVMRADETRRLLVVASSLKVRGHLDRSEQRRLWIARDAALRQGRVGKRPE
jgi:hypothetical protein